MNNNKPEVSFLLPAFKRKHLKESIESILHQTYHDFELVIVNDASPENLIEIISEYITDNRVRYYQNNNNIGSKNLIKQWNYCLSLATGRWVVMASDDDIYESTYLEEMVRLTKQYPNEKVFHCNILQIDDNNNITHVASPNNVIESSLDQLYWRLIRFRLHAFQDFMIERNALLALGGYVDFPLATYSDVATIVSAVQSGSIICSNQYLMKWRYSGENISSSTKTAITRLSSCESILLWSTKFVETYQPRNYVEKYEKEQFLSCIKNSMTGCDYHLISLLSNKQLIKLLSLKEWPYSLFSKRYIIKHIIYRIKKSILLK